MGISRCLVSLDEFIDPDHERLADKEGVIFQLRYTQLSAILKEHKLQQCSVKVDPTIMTHSNPNTDTITLTSLTTAVDKALADKNAQNTLIGKPPLASYYRDYALLQEVTKAACKQLCGNTITIAHTMPQNEIRPTSVTSFYEVGLGIGLYTADDFVIYSEQEGQQQMPMQAPSSTTKTHTNTSLNLNSNIFPNNNQSFDSNQDQDPVSIASEYLDFCMKYPPPNAEYLQKHFRWFFRNELQPGDTKDYRYDDPRNENTKHYQYVHIYYIHTFYIDKCIIHAYVHIYVHIYASKYIHA